MSDKVPIRRPPTGVPGLDALLEVEATSPAMVIVDSFRSVMQAVQRQAAGPDVQHFVQELGMRLTGWEATTFLVGEFQLAETENHPIFAVADGIPTCACCKVSATSSAVTSSTGWNATRPLASFT